MLIVFVFANLYYYFSLNIYGDFFHLVIVSNFLYILYYIIFSKHSLYVSPLHKAFIIILLIPPFSHVLVSIIFNKNPLFIYPNYLKNTMHQIIIERVSYCISLISMNLVLFFCNHIKLPALKLFKKSSNKLLFFLFSLMTFLFSILSMIGNKAAIFTGNYATGGESNFADINAWNAMATISFLFTIGYMDLNKKNQKIFLIINFLTAIILSSILFGKRADIVGLILVIIVIILLKKINIYKLLIAIIISISGYISFAITAYLRFFGVKNFNIIDILNDLNFLKNTDSFMLPSITDFYSTLPYVYSYLRFDSGTIWLGKSYFNAITTLLPSIINPFRIEESATTFLQSTYWMFNGGMYFIAEIFFNFGITGVILVPIFISLCFNYLINKTKKAITFIIILIIIDGFPRWLYYGTSAFTKHLFLIFLFYFFGLCVKNIVGICCKEKD